jgi:hypothetical protein
MATTARHTPPPSDQRREQINQLEYADAKAEVDAKEAALQARVREATERSLQGNQWLKAQEAGLNNFRSTVQNGRTTIEQINPKVGNLTGHDFTAPQALVDTLNVWVGGIQLGPVQAREMMQRGEISQDAYYAAVDKALAPYGYGRFR